MGVPCLTLFSAKVKRGESVVARAAVGLSVDYRYPRALLRPKAGPAPRVVQEQVEKLVAFGFSVFVNA